MASPEGVENEKSLTDHSLSGFSWLAGRTVVTRFVQYGGQIVLAWLLAPSAFGLIGMAYAIQAFATLVQQSGIDKVLVARQDEFDELANPGFWGALATGLVAGGLMFISAPIAADMLNSPGLTELILILAIATPFKALWLVPQAALSIDLRFDLIAIINTGAVVLQMGLTIVLATQDFGAQSFVLPALVVNPLIAAVLYGLTRPPLRWTPEFTKWPSIAAASGFLILASVFAMIIQKADYLIAGAIYPEETVGMYFMAYGLSVQAIMLLGTNVTSTLFPILSKIRENEARQRDAFLRVVGVSTLLMVPFSFFIAVTARPIVELLLDARWTSAILLIQILALGMSLRVLGGAAWAYLNARKRFASIARLSGINCGMFLLVTISLAPFGIEWFTAAVAVFYLFAPLLYAGGALGYTKQTVSDLFNILWLPVAASVLSALLSVTLARFIPNNTIGSVGEVLVACLFFALVNLVAVYWLAPSRWADLLLIREKVRGKLRGNEATPVA